MGMPSSVRMGHAGVMTAGLFPPIIGESLSLSSRLPLSIKVNYGGKELKTTSYPQTIKNSTNSFSQLN
jgi:hypothetical protein